MRYLDHLKQHHNFDWFIVLFDELDFTDEEIMAKLEISKQRIYDARKRLEPVLEALKNINDGIKIDRRNPEIQSVIDAFSENFGTTSHSQYDRWAAKRLVAKYTAPEIIRVIKALANFGGDKYAPTVNSVRQLEEKLPGVVKFLRSKVADAPIQEL